MKKIVLIPVSLLGLCISACTLDNPIECSIKDKVELSISTPSGFKSKTGISSDGSFFWSSGDALKLFETATGPESFSVYDSAPGESSEDGRKMSFSVSLSKKSASSYTYTAFYPQASLYSEPAEASAVAINLPSAQTPADMSFDKDADVLIARAENSAVQPSELSMSFKRPVAIGNVTIVGLPAGSTVETVTFSAVKGGHSVPVAGATTFDLNTAAPVGQYGDAFTQNAIVIDCSKVGVDVCGNTSDYSVRDFDWSDGSLSDPSSPSSIKGNGIFFTCWPFSLAAGDSFKLDVRVGTDVYTRNVTIPQGRTFEMPEGNVGSFAVDMGSVSPVYSPDDYLSKWNEGQDIVIGGRTYNKSAYGEATLVEDGGSLTAKSGVYIIETDASVTIDGAWSPSVDGNLVVIGRTPGNRPTVTLTTTAPCRYKGAGKSIAFKNISFKSEAAPVFYLDAQLSALDIEDCNLDIGVLYTQEKDGVTFENVSIKNNIIALCKEDIQSGNRDNCITRGTKNTSMSVFEFSGNVVYPLNGVPSRFGFNADLPSSGISSTVDKVIFNDNLFVDVAPYGSFANWSNDYSLEMKGNIIDFDGVRTDANSLNNDLAEIYYFAQRVSGETLTDIDVEGNAAYFSVPSYYCMAAVRQPRSETNRFQVAVPRESVLANRDFANGEFPLKRGALYAEAVANDGTIFWGSVDCTNHKIYINHVPRADMISSVKIWPSSCECSALGGNWPSRTISVDDVQYDVILPDFVDGTPLSGYTLQWADEFTLDRVDYQAWRNTANGGGASGYSDPEDNSLATVSDGTLKLWYRTVTDRSKGYWPTGKSLGYVAGGIDSRYRRDFSFRKDARIQVRMKWNEMQGLWQAAWMLADPNQAYGTDRKCVGGELDILEHLGTQSAMYQTIHTENSVTGGLSEAAQRSTTKTQHDDTWFTFDVEVANAGTANAVVNFYINGTKSASKSADWKSYWSSGTYYWPFDAFDYCMILTAQIGGKWCGDPDGTTAIAAGTKAMTVDYVRYYTKN